MERVLRGIAWSECLLYLDDILVFGPNFGTTLARLERVLDRLGEGLKLNRLGLTPDSRSAVKTGRFLLLGHSMACLHGTIIQNRVYQWDGEFPKLSVLINV